eukprot:scaffold78965_cov34-Tisochrysis_lutea.AAC.1
MHLIPVCIPTRHPTPRRPQHDWHPTWSLGHRSRCNDRRLTRCIDMVGRFNWNTGCLRRAGKSRPKWKVGRVHRKIVDQGIHILHLATLDMLQLGHFLS